MRTKTIKKHLLPLSMSGSGRFINSIHYGYAGRYKKVYIQSGLHAEEAPGYMVMHYLLELLDIADSQDKIRGEIICVPAANPIGLDQWFYDRPQGRFDTSNGVNFNRNFPDIVEETAKIIENQLTNDPDKNRDIIRDAMKIAIDNLHPEDEAGALKKLLFSLSFDADVVLDLHCDNQAIMHIYTGESLWSNSTSNTSSNSNQTPNLASNPKQPFSSACELAAWTGAEAILLADESGGDPYDEACSKIWCKLKELYPDYPIYPSCLAATIEYRGEADVSEELNRQDAINLYSFLHQQGYLSGDIPLKMPELKIDATPLSGVEHIKAPVSGIVNFLRRPGEMLKAGDKVAEIMNPYSQNEENRITELFCKIDGLLFSLTSDRMARQGRILAKIAGKKPIEGKGKHLLTA
ncbi:MAG: succinylglutamate desuccinylase/aspartoacylase family protein [Desulfamplus sp.]|nr:succinylglutamate desuccinylase/aspartoacylase family protein [Desulfamplus sp.]